MKIEIVEFYTSPHQKFDCIRGTLHVYLCDEGIDLRGIVVDKNEKGKWRFIMPYQWGKDPETGKSVRYPLINFTLRRKNQDLIQEIQKLAPKYIKEKLKDE